MSSPVVVLGAGLAGLSFAHHYGLPVTVLERETVVGGTARSHRRGSFVFDVTGHWLHLKDDALRTWLVGLMGGELQSIARRAEIHSHGVRTPFPFQANTYGLPVDVVAECVLGYFRAREARLAQSNRPVESFDDFIRLRMGDGIARHFMVPYNTKLYTVPPAELAASWCERFVPVPTPEEVVQGALSPGGASHGMGYNSSFYYPTSGGIGTLATAVAGALEADLRLGTEARAIDWRARRVESDAGGHAYDVLVSTLPLPLLVDRLVDAPSAVRAARELLRWNAVTYWDIGVAGANGAADAHWIYFPDLDVPFYRAGSPSAAAPHTAPQGQRSYYVEVAHPQGTACPVTDEQVLASMRHVGLMRPHEEPVVCARSCIEPAYVLMDHAYGRARATLHEWLNAQRILSIGRYGDWTYDSMEGAMLQGRSAVARVRELVAAAAGAP